MWKQCKFIKLNHNFEASKSKYHLQQQLFRISWVVCRCFSCTATFWLCIFCDDGKQLFYMHNSSLKCICIMYNNCEKVPRTSGGNIHLYKSCSYAAAIPKVDTTLSRANSLRKIVLKCSAFSLKCRIQFCVKCGLKYTNHRAGYSYNKITRRGKQSGSSIRSTSTSIYSP